MDCAGSDSGSGAREKWLGAFSDRLRCGAGLLSGFSLLVVAHPVSLAWNSIGACRRLAGIGRFSSALSRDLGMDDVSRADNSDEGGTWSRRTLWSLFGATAWVALEMTVARIFGGFPWNLLDFALSDGPLIQVASITGVYGVSFLIVWTSLSLLCAAKRLLRAPAMRSVWLAEIFLPILTVAILFALGSYRMMHGPVATLTLKVAFVQPSIPQTLIWDESKDDERFQDLLRLSEQALTNKIDLLLWPEAAVPKMLRHHKESREAVTGLARKHHVSIIIGADDAEPRPGAKSIEDVDFYNSSFLISPEGRIAGIYRKRALVIFGEYIPLEHVLPLFKWFTPIQGGFTAGERAIPFELDTLRLKLL